MASLSIYTCASWAPEQGSVRPPGHHAPTPTAFAAPPTDDSAFRTSGGLLGDGLVATSCLTFATPWAVACQAPLSLGSSREEYWNEFPFPSPGDLPNPGVEPVSPALAGGFFTTSAISQVASL